MPSPGAKHSSFPVYDNMFYIGKPDTTKYGLIRSNIIDDAHIWPHGQNYGVLPSRSVFDALVAANNANPGRPYLPGMAAVLKRLLIFGLTFAFLIAVTAQLMRRPQGRARQGH